MGAKLQLIKKSFVFLIIFLFVISCQKEEEATEEYPTFGPPGVERTEVGPVGRVAIPNTIPNVDIFNKKQIIKLEYPLEMDPKAPLVPFVAEIERGTAQNSGYIWNKGFRLNPNTNEWIEVTFAPAGDDTELVGGGWIKHKASYTDDISTNTVMLATGVGKEGVDANAVLIFTCQKVELKYRSPKQWKCGCETREETGKCMKWIKQDFTIESLTPKLEMEELALAMGEAPSVICEVPTGGLAEVPTEEASGVTAAVVGITGRQTDPDAGLDAGADADATADGGDATASGDGADAGTVDAGGNADATADAGLDAGTDTTPTGETLEARKDQWSKTYCKDMFGDDQGNTIEADPARISAKLKEEDSVLECRLPCDVVDSRKVAKCYNIQTHDIIPIEQEGYNVEPKVKCPEIERPDFKLTKLVAFPRIARFATHLTDPSDPTTEVIDEMESITMRAEITNEGTKEYKHPLLVEMYRITPDFTEELLASKTFDFSVEGFRRGQTVVWEEKLNDDPTRATKDLGGERHRINVVVDPKDEVYELSEENNLLAEPLRMFVGLKPELTVAQKITITPELPKPGDEVIFETEITNEGTKESGEFEFKWYVTPKGLKLTELAPQELRTMTETKVIEAMGAVNTNKLTLAIKEKKKVQGKYKFDAADEGEGEYEVRLLVEPDSTKLPEFDKQNNAAETPVSLILQPDLKVKEIQFVDSSDQIIIDPKINQDIFIKAIIENLGTRKAENFEVNFNILNDDGTPRSEPPVTVANVDARSTVDIKLRDPQRYTTPGSYPIKVTVDETNILPEFNERNNEETKTLEIISKPDFEVVEVKLIDLATGNELSQIVLGGAQQQFAAKITINNAGTEPYSGNLPIKLELFSGNQKVATLIDPAVTGTPIPTVDLQPNPENDDTKYETVTSDQLTYNQVGTYDVRATIEQVKKQDGTYLPEFRENNNIGSGQIQVKVMSTPIYLFGCVDLGTQDTARITKQNILTLTENEVLGTPSGACKHEGRIGYIIPPEHIQPQNTLPLYKYTCNNGDQFYHVAETNPVLTQTCTKGPKIGYIYSTTAPNYLGLKNIVCTNTNTMYTVPVGPLQNTCSNFQDATEFGFIETQSTLAPQIIRTDLSTKIIKSSGTSGATVSCNPNQVACGVEYETGTHTTKVKKVHCCNVISPVSFALEATSNTASNCGTNQVACGIKYKTSFSYAQEIQCCTPTTSSNVIIGTEMRIVTSVPRGFMFCKENEVMCGITAVLPPNQNVPVINNIKCCSITKSP